MAKKSKDKPVNDTTTPALEASDLTSMPSGDAPEAADHSAGVMLELPLVRDGRRFPVREISLGRKGARFLADVTEGLVNDKAQLANGKMVETSADAVEWMAEWAAAAAPAAV